MFPNSPQHLKDGAGGHAVYHLVNHIGKQIGYEKQSTFYFYPFLAPLYGMMSKAKKHNSGLKKDSWFTNLYSKPMFRLPKDILGPQTVPMWQKNLNLKPFGEMDYSIVHLHTAFSLGILAKRLAEEKGKKLVVTIRREVHDDVWNSYPSSYQRLCEAAILAADRVVTPSVISARKIKTLFSREADVVPNGTNTLFDSYENEKQRRPKSILFVGNLDDNKNVLLLVDSFKNILKQEPEATLTIVGNGYLKNKLLASIEGVSAITYLGRLPAENVREEMRKHTIFCVPSYTETFGLVYAEAMKQKMAVIARAETGIDGFGENGRDYQLIKNNEDLEGVLIALINDPVKCESMGKYGRELALEWNWDRSASRYIEIYNDIV